MTTNSERSVERLFFRDVAHRYVNCVNILAEMKSQLQIEMMEFFEKEYFSLP